MITIHRQPFSEFGGVQFEISPNGSLSRRNLMFSVVVIVICGAFAITLSTVFGLWIVSPFYGLEASALVFCLFRSYRLSGRRELITVTDSSVIIERNYMDAEKFVNLKRAWVACSIAKSVRMGHPSQLTLSLHGRHVEIGRFLAEPERLQLAIQLKQILPARAALI